jgi:hypothetical protein
MRCGSPVRARAGGSGIRAAVALALGLGGCVPAPDPEESSVADGRFVLQADARLALPYAVVGDQIGPAALRVTNAGERDGRGALSWTTEGPFEVSGDAAPLASGEQRILSVAWNGSTDAPALHAGIVTVEADGQVLSVAVGAVVGDPELPATVDWNEVDGGFETTVSLPSAPFPDGRARYDDDSVYLFVPADLTDGRGVGVVTHLHGHYATLDTTIPRQKIREQHALSGRDAVLVVPQGPENAADSDFGRLDEAGGFAVLVRDVITLMFRDGLVVVPTIGHVALTAHSGGYNATANILGVGGVPVHAVHLLDALYAREDDFRSWLGSGGVLRSSYTAYGGTSDENLALAEALVADGFAVSDAFDDATLDASIVTIGYAAASHDGCVAWDRGYARWLAASGLPVRPLAPPTLLSVLSDGTTATVRWRADRGPSVPDGDAFTYVVQGSEDGRTWRNLATTVDTTATTESAPWIRVLREDAEWGLSDPSDTYGGTGTDWLVVDGFDRVLDGSWTGATHPFAAWLGVALGEGVSVVANEAVESGEVDLRDHDRVLWMLGDEGVSDVTFSEAEKEAIADYLAGGGRLIASGAEIGYATDADWLQDTLHAALVADDAGTATVGEHALGAAYPEDYPDVLAGERTVLRYDNGAAAAVAWSDRVVVVGFGVENLPDTARVEVLAVLAEELR